MLASDLFVEDGRIPRGRLESPCQHFMPVEIQPKSEDSTACGSSEADCNTCEGSETEYKRPCGSREADLNDDTLMNYAMTNLSLTSFASDVSHVSDRLHVNDTSSIDETSMALMQSVVISKHDSDTNCHDNVGYEADCLSHAVLHADTNYKLRDYPPVELPSSFILPIAVSHVDDCCNIYGQQIKQGNTLC